MKHLFKSGASGLFAVLLFAGGTQTVFAVGTASGDIVSNTASVAYTVGVGEQTPILSTDDAANPPGTATTFAVDNKVDLTVASVDAGTITVAPGSTDQVLEFTVTNTGNTTQGYALSVTNGTTGIAMTNVEIWLDTDGSGDFDPLLDTLYVAAANAGDLDPNSLTAGDDTLTAFIVSDTPLTAADGSVDTYNLVATTLDAGTTDVTVDTAVNTENGVEVAFADAAGTVDAANDGAQSAAGTYTVGSATLAVIKTADVNDGLGGTYAIPGAVVTYTITVENSGGTAATSVAISDAIPPNTTYVAGSITLNAVAQTDASDTPTDESDFNVTTVGSVTVNIATVAAASTSTITFQVTIN